MQNPPSLKPAPIASPCTGVCRIDPASGWCEGCARTLDEIAAWGSLDPMERRAVCKQLPARRAALATTLRPLR
ncbi:DUF1289 domain-containing protein [Piscinibacter koreensis]|uniref:DUF1289 domain-containing protein n=1 Tax=Piscinibacter koreensis TaxID=2742824 RepID=A0A7Y6NNS2_9BURK|nr:DUF1289 domain-containing protein [Schlegelella koreensis]NUZ06519.1 DUF1289 domain-containing protein [Schlegelella koreensis]